MKTFVLNGNTYEAKEIDFNMVCDFDDCGIPMEKLLDSPMKTCRAYVACCMGTSIADAGDEINAHIVGGGNMSDIMTIFADQIEASDFFQSISKNAEKTTPARKGKKSKAESTDQNEN